MSDILETIDRGGHNPTFRLRCANCDRKYVSTTTRVAALSHRYCRKCVPTVFKGGRNRLAGMGIHRRTPLALQHRSMKAGFT